MWAVTTSKSRHHLQTHPGGKIVYLSPLLIDRSEEHIRFTIAHEIAHAVLSDAEGESSRCGG